MTAYDERREIMQLAETLNTHKLELQRIIGGINTAVAALVGQGDSLMLKAAEHSPEAHGVTVKPITVTSQAEVVAQVMKPFKRACSHCGKPGHRATTCPDAHLPSIKEAKVKKQRKLSPERKAQLVETLKKARAARRNKR